MEDEYSLIQKEVRSSISGTSASDRKYGKHMASNRQGSNYTLHCLHSLLYGKLSLCDKWSIIIMRGSEKKSSVTVGIS